ncbi:MAG: serine/threonine protein kinase [Myxococcales bacterium]
MHSVNPSPVKELIPARLGRYEIVQKLSAGGMADIYLAHQAGPFSADKLLVVKQLRAGAADNEQFVQMFADESRIAVRLNHPNVVQTYEAVADDDEYFLVMEYLDGKSLHQILTRVTREKMPLGLHLWILTQVLTGLHYAHELKEFDGTPLGIVHRDVSPSNVFVTHEGGVKLLDFGIAKAVGAITATREGIIKGKLGYAAPEQCLCGETDRRTDLFAVGVMLWEAIAGCKRPSGETEASTYQARIQGTEMRIEQAAPNTPAPLVNICNRALARYPEKRFQTALEFRQAIERYLQSIKWGDGTELLRSFMHQHFSNDIVEMRRCIDEHLGRSRSNEARLVASIGPTSVTRQQDLVGSAGLERAETPMLLTSRIARHLRRPIVIVGVSGGVLLTLVLASWLSNSRPDATASPAASNIAAAANAAVAPPVVTVPAGQISVSLAAEPASAELRLDGRRISNPYRAAHGRDQAQHHLTASLAGFETLEKDLSFDQDIYLTVTLDAYNRWRKAAAAQRAPLSSPARPASRQEPKAETAPAAPAAAAAAAKPGDSLLRSKKSSRDVDDSNPYKR